MTGRMLLRVKVDCAQDEDDCAIINMKVRQRHRAWVALTRLMLNARLIIRATANG